MVGYPTRNNERRDAFPSSQKSAARRLTAKTRFPDIYTSRRSLRQMNFAGHRRTMTIARIAIALQRRLWHFSNVRTVTRRDSHRKRHRKIGVKITILLADQVKGFTGGVDQRDRRARKPSAGLGVNGTGNGPDASACNGAIMTTQTCFARIVPAIANAKHHRAARNRRWRINT